MTLTLSDQDHRRLMILTLLGEWVVNATRKDPDPAYEDTASKVYEAAQGTSAETWVTFDPDDQGWAPSARLEEEAHALIDQYDDVTFWEELTARLTERDMIAKHGERAVRSMRPEQRERAAKSFAQAYSKEFEDQGLERLFVTP